jgi:hypothetical protein
MRLLRAPECECIHCKITQLRARLGIKLMRYVGGSGKMDLSEGIRLKVEKHGEKDIILDVMKSLQDDGVVITEDVYEAIITTLRFTQGIIDN